MQKVEANKTYIGVVEDNNDPKKLGRVKIKVLNVFDELKTEDLPWAKPWKDLNGNSFNIPDIGKVVTVIFESGNTYSPEYIYADHYNANLEKKLSELNTQDYLSMKSLIFDHKTQIYVNDGEGLKLDHKFNLINIKERSININLKDNFGKVNIGTEKATQRAILGDNFLNWFDDFVKILLGDKGGPFLGNLGAPVIPTPALMGQLQLYEQLKNPKFLSKHVSIVDNESVKKLNRISDGQKGDTWKSTIKENDLVKQEPVGYTPTSGATDTSFEKPQPSAPDQSQTSQTSTTQTTQSSPDSSVKPKPTEHPDVAILLDLMKSKNYKIYSRENEMNIISIRNQCLNTGERYTDEFVDFIYLLYKNKEGFWEVSKYNISTVPGVEFTVTDSWIKEKKLDGDQFWVDKRNQSIKTNNKEYYSYIVSKNQPTNPWDQGLNILVPSQYVDVYEISTFRGVAGLTTRANAKVKVWIDKTFDKPFEFIPSNLTRPVTITMPDVGNFKYGIHLGYPGGKKVGDWSEASQVFPTSDELTEFFSLLESHRKNWGNSFTYTIATRVDFDRSSKNVEIDRTNNRPLVTPVP
jgi:hypothetical protein